MITRASLLRLLGEMTPQNTAAYDALVDVTRGAEYAVTPAALLMVCRSLYFWRQDILQHDEAYLAVYRRALATVCASEVITEVRP